MGFFMVGTIWSDLGFLLVGAFYWGLIIASGISFLIGLFKKSWKAFLTSGITFIIPALTLASQEGYFTFFLFLPLLAIGLAIITKKNH
ncbi:hypothetical protein [Bacillus massilinigeriensis]|uniref:hypothetical protein n=1 Tax=Bacillus massilionigeriensis TaxID=1805475 RepID=UPI000A0171CA|nr:hypothetical protein [Bacillus massilionigeriensis]